MSINRFTGFEYEKQVVRFFEDNGWEVRQEVSFASFRFDMILCTQGIPVGAVECKMSDKNNKYTEQYMTKLWYRLSAASDTFRFLILYINGRLWLTNNNGFMELLAIPTPSNYLQLVSIPSQNYNQIDKISYEYMQGLSLEQMVWQSFQRIGTIEELICQIFPAIQGSKKEIIEKVEDVYQKLSSQLNGFQNLTSKQLEKLDNFPEAKEYILEAFTEEIAEVIQNKMQSKDGSKEFLEKKIELMSIFGDSWEKLTEASQRYLISARLMFSSMLAYIDYANQTDFSGVCILLTKALEDELKKRWYKDLIKYYEEKNVDIDYYPSSHIRKLSKAEGGTLVKNEDTVCTLGWLETVISPIDKGSYKKNKSDPRNTAPNRYKYLMQYLQEYLLPEKTTDEINEILDRFHNKIHKIREQFRNKAAHPYMLNMNDAKDCMNIIVDGERLLKEIVTTFAH